VLVGREHERQVLDRLLAAARVGRSGALLVTGEPGIGKSAVLADARARAAGMRLVEVRGAVAEQEVSFAGLHQLCTPVIALLDRLPEPQQQALGIALRTRTGPSPDRFGVGVATLGLLSRAADDDPLLVLVDDAHLLDRPSAEALAFAARRLVSDRVVLVVAMRPDEQSPLAAAGLEPLPLAGLDLEAARLLVGGPRERVAHLHRATAGNPLALLELAARPQDLRGLEAGVPVPLARGLQDAFAARSDDLPDAARQVLLLAAAGTRDLVLLDLACRAHGLDVGDLVHAERAGLVRVGPGSVEFRHPLVRAAVHGAADPGRRRWAHRALADALEKVQDAVPSAAVGERRAWHLSEATLGPDEEVAATLALAAVGADARGAHAVAASMLERAAALSPDPAERTTRTLAAAGQAWSGGLPRRATGLLDRVVATATPAQAVRVSELRGAVEARCGSLPAARDTLLRGAEQAVPLDPDRAVLLLADAVHVCFYLGDIASALAAAERLTDLVGPATAPPVRGVGLVAAGVAHVLAGHGDQGAGLVRAGLAEPVPTGPQDPLRVQWQVLGPMFLREATVREQLGAQVGRLRRGAASAHLSMLLGHLARDDAGADRWADAEAGYLEAARLADELGQSTDAAFALAGLSWLHARRGEEEQARETAARAGALAERHEVHLARVWAAYALGDLEAGAGRAEAAQARYRDLLGLLDRLGLADPDLSPAPELAETCWGAGRRAEAAATADRYLVAARAKGQPWALARAHRAVGTTRPGGVDEEHLEAALAHHARTPDVYETARTRLAFGAGLRRDRRPADARPLLEAAVDELDRLGARPWADRAAAELRASGRTVRRRGTGPVQQLTPQERQTAQVLAGGLTTREAAAALFLSPKTVEFHLRNVYIKLGIHSREELARVVREQVTD
jgi:DNA-binding CsgD family transcriptional regulator